MVGTGSLQMTDVDENDAGNYQCRAENREDSVDATATLHVQGEYFLNYYHVRVVIIISTHFNLDATVRQILNIKVR